MKNKNVYKITLGGICLALTLVFMFGASIVPGAEMTLYAVSSLFIAVMIIETGVKGGAALYAAAVLLGLLIVPNKIGILPYACVFGLYGIVKFYIEKVKNPVMQVQMCIRDSKLFICRCYNKLYAFHTQNFYNCPLFND